MTTSPATPALSIDEDGEPPVVVAIPIPSVDDNGVHSHSQPPDGQ